MNKNYMLVLGILGLILLAAADFYTVRSEIAHKASLTYSNTASWAPQYWALANSTTTYPESIYANISLPPPPANTSAQVAKELATLTSYEKLRSPKEVQDFIAEGQKDTLYMGGHTFAEYTDPKEFPATAALLKDSFHDVEVIEMQQKKIFDRVRPSVLDPDLTTIIPFPGHPAYPSYRSTEMHFLAYVFGELAPARKQEFVTRADGISLNCQIAGLQYPSDTAGGVLLAQQIFADLMQNAKFETLLAAAKKEWAADGLTTPPALSPS